MSNDNDKSRIAEIRCPFYSRHTYSGSVICEGIAFGSHLDTRFACREDQKRYMRTYCETGYRSCPIHTILLRGYEDT